MLPEWTVDFLAQLETSPNVSAAARAAGVTRQAAYKLRDEHPEFAAAWQDALESGVDELVGNAWRRAGLGETALTIFMLKCHRPAVYGDKVKQEVHHSGGVTFYIPDNSRDRSPGPDDHPAPAGPPGSVAGQSG